MRESGKAGARRQYGRKSPASPPRVWAVGGGKGGVGKSVLSSNLGVFLARSGERCALIDADLGGANLHTLLGVDSPARTLAHFFGREVLALADVMCSTRFSNLSLISGAGDLLDAANPHHSQKAKLLRHLRTLPVEHVILDLSADSSHTTLDCFLEAERGVLVATPEPTSIENAYHFLKAAYFRHLRSAAKQPRVREAIEEVLEANPELRQQSPRELVERVSQADLAAGVTLAARARAFAPLLVVNKVSTLDHRRLGTEVAAQARESLGIEIRFIGALEADDHVTDAVGRKQPVIDLHTSCPYAEDLEEVARRALRGESVQVEALEAPPEAEPRTEPAAERPDSPTPETPQALPPAAPETGPTPVEPATPGETLRRRREELGLALTDLRRRTRLLSLENLELERFSELPPEPYVRGHVLQYAQALGIQEPESLATRFLARYREALAEG